MVDEGALPRQARPGIGMKLFQEGLMDTGRNEQHHPRRSYSSGDPVTLTSAEKRVHEVELVVDAGEDFLWRKDGATSLAIIKVP